MYTVYGVPVAHQYSQNLVMVIMFFASTYVYSIRGPSSTPIFTEPYTVYVVFEIECYQPCPPSCAQCRVVYAYNHLSAAILYNGS